MFQTLRWHPSVAPGLCLVRCVTLYCDPHTLHRTQCYVRGFVRKTCLQNSFIYVGCLASVLAYQKTQIFRTNISNLCQEKIMIVPQLLSVLYVPYRICCVYSDGLTQLFILFQKWPQWVKVWVYIEVTRPRHRARTILWTKKLLRDHASIMLEGILWHVISK